MKSLILPSVPPSNKLGCLTDSMMYLGKNRTGSQDIWVPGFNLYILTPALTWESYLNIPEAQLANLKLGILKFIISEIFWK